MKICSVLDQAIISQLLEIGGTKEVVGYIWAKSSRVVEEMYGLTPTPAGKMPVEASITSDVAKVDTDLSIDVKTADHAEYAVFYFEHAGLKEFAGNLGGIKEAGICNPITEKFCWDYAKWLEENGLTGESDIVHATIEGLIPETFGFAATAKLLLQ